MGNWWWSDDWWSDHFYAPLSKAFPAYTIAALRSLPMHELLSLWEAHVYAGTREWIAGQPNEYTDQRANK